MNAISRHVPPALRQALLVPLLLALLAGLLGCTIHWLSTVWMIHMPWNNSLELSATTAWAWLAFPVLALCAAWVFHCVPTRRAWLLVGVASLLCFTGSAALSLHNISFDPIAAALSMLLGGLAVLWLNRRPIPVPESPVKIFAGQLSESALSELEGNLQECHCTLEERPLFLLTCCIRDARDLRKKLGPFEFLALTAEVRRMASALLLTRKALVLPGSGEVLQAGFGIPIASEGDGPWAADTARLLEFALREFRHGDSEVVPAFCISLIHGLAMTGRVGSAYQVAGDLLDRGRLAADESDGTQIERDEVTAAWLPVSTPHTSADPAPQIPVTPALKPKPAAKRASKKTTATTAKAKPRTSKRTPSALNETPPQPEAPAKKAAKKGGATSPKARKKRTSEEN